MPAIAPHYYLDALGAVVVWAIAWRVSLGRIQDMAGLRIGQPKAPEKLARKLAIQLAVMPVPVVATDAYSLLFGEAGWALPALRVGAVLLIALWIVRTLRMEQK